jgi:hypothetical protein
MRLVSTFPYALALWTLAGPACTGNATPLQRSCPTVQESVTYEADGSCGPGGIIVVSTDPGLCDVRAAGGLSAGIPDIGSFNGNAASSGYHIAGGAWTLYKGSSDPGNPAYASCDAVAATQPSDLLLLNCNFNDCTPTDQDSWSCTLNPCVMHLKAPADAGVAADSGGADAGGG